MLAKGNGNIENCTRNLMRIYKGETPYARNKGVDGKNIDRPLSTVVARLATETRKMIEEYEPRAEVDNASVKVSLAQLGYLQIEVETTGGK